MGTERRNGSYGGRGDFFFSDNPNALDRLPGENGGFTDHNRHGDSYSSLVKLFPISLSSPSASTSQLQASTSQSAYIQHHVSKYDTLAGIAIRYGVEVADIKRLNGLVTDIQMFALKSVSIPPGRHPPSTCLSNVSEASGESSSERTPPRHYDLLESFQSLRLKSSSQEKISPAMNSLRGYYKLRSNNNSQEELPQSDIVEMAAYRNQEDGPFLRTSPSYYPPLSRHKKSSSLANSFEEMEMAGGGETESEWWSEKLMRRRQKSETDFSKSTEKKKILEENGSVAGGSGGGGGGFSPITGKGLAQRSKQAGGGGGGGSGSGQNLISLGGDSGVVGDGGVRKSTSTPSLQDQETGTIRWGTSWRRSSKPDLLAPPSAATSRPILPMSGWKSKAALD